VLGAIVLEASLIALLGSAIGVLIGGVTTWLVNVHYQGVYRTPLLFAIVTPEILIFSVGLSLVLGIAAGAIVGARLVRTPPLALFGR
jgi:putative ABC transport system permease protein